MRFFLKLTTDVYDYVCLSGHIQSFSQTKFQDWYCLKELFHFESGYLISWRPIAKCNKSFHTNMRCITSDILCVLMYEDMGCLANHRHLTEKTWYILHYIHTTTTPPYIHDNTYKLILFISNSIYFPLKRLLNFISACYKLSSFPTRLCWEQPSI